MNNNNIENLSITKQQQLSTAINYLIANDPTFVTKLMKIAILKAERPMKYEFVSNLLNSEIRDKKLQEYIDKNGLQ